ncbi:MAG: sulfite exporter TauE/SafE family protein [Nannocystaceae bacterium]
MELDLWLLALLIASANAVQVIVGFGASMLTLTIASLFAPIDALLPLLVPLNLGTPIYLAARYRGAVDTQLLLRQMIPLGLVGLALGFALFLVIDGAALTLAYGLFVVGLSGLRLTAALRERTRLPAPTADAAADAATASRAPAPSRLWLVAGGLCHGLFATGGPVLVLYTAAVLTDKQRFRCTMAGLWIPLNAALLTGYALKGSLTPTTLETSARLAPALLVGVVAGEFVHRRLSQSGFNILVYSLILFAGVLLLAGG